MSKILIIYPHFPPSNLAGVHRPRLFAMHLPSFGWEPVILTVDEKYYEEALDWDLVNLLPAGLRIEKVKAYNITRPRMIGDIGLRAFFQLYKKAKSLITKESFDFLYIPVPSFYCALLGRWLHRSTGIKYGIDYIDPWVHNFPGSNKLFSRHWFSTKIAKFLEPVAIKEASLITGVAEGYYLPVLDRNPVLKAKIVHRGMPYGGEAEDHVALRNVKKKPYLFADKKNKLRLTYAGAMLPKAYKPLEAIFKSVSSAPGIFADFEFHFIGTGKTPDDSCGYNIRPLAEKYKLWNTIVFEYPKRIPYLDVLLHLEASDGLFILGSTEPHYTPSKVYQGVLSRKPILAVLHNESTAAGVIENSKAGVVLKFEGEKEMLFIEENFVESFKDFKMLLNNFDPSEVKMDEFRNYSARSVTRQLAKLLDEAVLGKSGNSKRLVNAVSDEQGLR